LFEFGVELTRDYIISLHSTYIPRYSSIGSVITYINGVIRVIEYIVDIGSFGLVKGQILMLKVYLGKIGFKVEQCHLSD
jgi:hypothetical protein